MPRKHWQPSLDFSAPPAETSPAESGRSKPANGHVARVKRAAQASLFDFDYSAEITPEPETETPPPINLTPQADSQDAESPTLPDIASGEKAKALDIIAAIKTLKRCEREERPATPEEKKLLARFPGFGPVALSIFPDPVTGKVKDGWREIVRELEHQLTPEEYASAKRSTYNAFYTSPIVIKAMHEALERLGVPPDATVVEPGCGVCPFMAYAPPEMKFIGVELESITGRIAKLLHPDQDIRIEPFQDSRLPQVDAAIGNPPFADVKLDLHGQKFSLHDFCIAKSLDSLKPGGILAMVTSHFTLDRQNAEAREYFGSQADFLGAIRLPSDAFKREGTAVVTDIVFFRKRAPGEHARHEEAEWERSRPFEIDGTEVSINRYFVRHPEMVLGDWTTKDTLYGEGFSVTSNGDLAEQLKEAVGRLPAFEPPVRRENRQTEPVSDTYKLPPNLSEGSFFIDDSGTIRQILDGQAEAVVYGGTKLSAHGTMTGKRMAALIGLRDRARAVLKTQNEGQPETDRNEARKELNWAYDNFVAKYGPINKTTFSETGDGTIRRMPNIVKFREDPDAMLVLSLEEYDEGTGTAKKAAIMSRDVVGRKPPVTSVVSAEEGLLVSLNQHGKVDLEYISELYGKPEKDIIAELGDLIYLDPESKEWQTADEYLSGNVRHKLAVAEAAGDSRNAEALRRVQPEDVLPGDIDANLGAPWIPESDIQAFAADLFRVDLSDIEIGHVKKDAAWSVEPSYSAKASVGATTELGTARANGTWLLELALNQKSPTIYDQLDDDTRVVNQEQTMAAREKQKQIKERFRSWIFSDPERTDRLVRTYNDLYNNLRPRLFDGSHLDFPGMSQAFTMRQHQKDAVWRGMSGGNTLLAHVVGAGKSAICAATGMKMKQAGLISKPMYVVPNHLLEQFGREFLHVYPNAKLLMASKEDFTRDKRKHLTAKIATGDWDGIIVTHSSFERIGMSREYQEKFLQQQIDEYNELIIAGAGKNTTRAHRNIIKSIEKQKAARQEKLKDLLAADKKDDGLVFDELGIDHILYDEAQAGKNLEAPTKMERVAGIPSGGSERAFDLFMKCRYLHEKHPGHGVTFATGTPISNSLVEMYTMQRYLDPDGLKERGLDHLDGWAATFGEVVESMEISPDGKTLKPRSRFAKFVNLPELQQMFRKFTDVQTADMLKLPRPALEGGNPHIVACPMSAEQSQIQQHLVERYERIRNGGVDPRDDNALAITTDGRKLALDARMVQPGQDFPNSKINALVDNVHAIWERTAPDRSTQLIFCDMGVHPTPWGFSAYEEITRKLAERGIPREQVASIGDADSDAKKQVLFEKVRQGTVRVLIGSTMKMGTGTNVQKRLIALHHLDAPWKPSEVEQREGRILRQGNLNKEVAIYRYVTTGSFDSYMWQTLQVKAKFINQIMSGESTGRRAEDIGGQELDYATVKSIASGNPAFLVLAETDAELQRLGILRRSHADEQFVARKRLKELPGIIADTKKRLNGLSEDMATIKAASDFTIGGHRVMRDDQIGVLGSALDSLPTLVNAARKIPLGTYRGLRFGMVLHPHFQPEVYLEGATTLTDSLSRDHHGPRAILNALERLAKAYPAEVERKQRDLTLSENQLRDFQARHGLPFQHEKYFTALEALRDQLKAALSGEKSDDGAEPDAAAIAENIKALRESNTLESAQERTARKIDAEVPVTTRILRQMQEEPETVVTPLAIETDGPDRAKQI